MQYEAIVRRYFIYTDMQTMFAEIGCHQLILVILFIDWALQSTLWLGSSPPKPWSAPTFYAMFRVHLFQVYAGIFPIDNNDFQKLEESINRVGGFQLDL